MGIILNSVLNYKVSSFDFDFNGRFLVLDLEINNIGYRLINVYMPKSNSERREFISKLSAFCNTSRNVILGGDFNFVENLQLDKKGGNIGFGDVGKVEIGLLKSDFHLVDIYRQKNSKERQFTWEGGSGHGKIQCRLDRFYISAKLCDKVSSVVHVPVVHSITDHHLICFDLISKSESIGLGFWKCNTSVLKDSDLRSDLKALWERELKSLEIIASEMWDSFKLKCKEVILFHSKRLNQIRFVKYKTLQNKLRNLKILNTSNLEEIQNCEIEINKFFDTFHHGCKIRSKVKSLNFEERTSRYFLNRERKKSENRIIDKLEVSNSLTVTKYKDIIFHVKQFYEQLFKKEAIDQSLVNYF